MDEKMEIPEGYANLRKATAEETKWRNWLGKLKIQREKKGSPMECEHCADLATGDHILNQCERVHTIRREVNLLLGKEMISVKMWMEGWKANIPTSTDCITADIIMTVTK
jgi:hypothetical protein